MKTLIAYFSYVGETEVNRDVVSIEKGHTETIAEKLQALTGGDIRKLEPVVPYSRDYRDVVVRARKENDDNTQVEIASPLENIDEYDVIYLGFPIWYRTFPRIISTFIRSYDFSGKTVCPFCTNDEGTFGTALLELRSMLKGATLTQGLSVHGSKVNESDDEIRAFVESNPKSSAEEVKEKNVLEASIDRKALYNLSYGVFVLSTKVGTITNGCITNTCIQVANDPTRLLVSVINKNYTCDLIKKSGVFAISVLDSSCTFPLIQHFGFQSGRDVIKFDETYPLSTDGIPYIGDQANALFVCKVCESKDLGSHTVFIGEIVESKRLSDRTPLTYADYQANVKPKNNTKTEIREIIGYRCKICGYVYEGKELPADYLCPLCGHDASDFEPIYKEENTEKKEEKKMAKWRCKVCGYVFETEGDTLPQDYHCPTCKVGADMFERIDETAEVQLAAEHEFGVYATTVKNNPNVSEEDKKFIFDQLVANFQGECSEVGMYLCMARVAHRQGYPEIGLYWEKAAFEEAEHAAKFAEMLGSDLEPSMTADTAKNLSWRVDCEFGATAGKVELAKCAKKNNLDAIHDTVHEMARDEARHGKALKGLLDRYFK